MSQKPALLLVGDGRLARHMRHYFSELNIDFFTWSRRENSITELQDSLSQVKRVMLMITDSQIASFIKTHVLNKYEELIVMHCSGAAEVDGAISVHPLQTFTKTLYAIEEYQKIPFIIERCDYSFNELLPGLSNPHYFIDSSRKAYYHALCVMANNFTTILWQKYFTAMSSEFGIEKKDLLPILKKTCENLSSDDSNVLTGPIARKDTETINRNLNALRFDDFHIVYQAFSELSLEDLNHE